VTSWKMLLLVFFRAARRGNTSASIQRWAHMLGLRFSAKKLVASITDLGQQLYVDGKRRQELQGVFVGAWSRQEL